MSDGTVLHFTRSAQQTRSVSSPITTWDAQKVYHVPVILLSFEDCDFSTQTLRGEEPRQFYDRMFNEHEFNLRKGPGGVADYFREQSNGLFNIHFDVVGPVKVTLKQKESEQYGDKALREAAKLAEDSLNYSDYDWDGNGEVEIVIYIYAGYGGNEAVDKAKGCMWPSTHYFSRQTLDGVVVNNYSASAELWSNDALCGIGTVCHEFSHYLGLPDLYPTLGSEFSVLDEWDLMDGGNFADDGWCPPNYSAHEREYLGWQQAKILSTTTVVTDMAPLSRGGEAYKIVNSGNDSEYYLLENRQWDGWDLMLPGHGLLITHVDFNAGSWTSNSVNTSKTHHRLDYFHPDGLDFNYFEDLYEDISPYGADGRNMRLQYSAYPYVDAEGISHDALTDDTTPDAKLFSANADGSLLMGKPIKEIRETDHLISFKFYESNAAGISPVSADARPVAYYDLQGRRITAPSSGLFIIKYQDGTTKKIIR